jgi:hypothetical protein
MTDLRNEFEQLAGPSVAPTGAELDADLARGRSALRHRRTGQAVGGSLFVAAAVAAAISLSGTLSTPGSDQITATGDRPAATAGADGLKLIAYTGKQPNGFTIDTVPQGWFVQGLNQYELVIAPDRAKNPGPNVDPSKAPIYDTHDYSNKIAVFMQSRDEKSPQGKTTKVGGSDVILRKQVRGMNTDPNGKMHPEPVRPDGDYGASVYVKQAKGAWVIVQFWEGSGFSAQQMMQLAAGVHAHQAAQGVG